MAKYCKFCNQKYGSILNGLNANVGADKHYCSAGCRTEHAREQRQVSIRREVAASANPSQTQTTQEGGKSSFKSCFGCLIWLFVGSVVLAYILSALDGHSSLNLEGDSQNEVISEESLVE